jgi:hypothetical protein
VSNPVLPETTPVLEAYLISGTNFKRIRLTRAVTPAELSGGYRELGPPVSNANVTLYDGVRSYSLIEDTSEIPNVEPRKTNRGSYILSPQDTLVIQSNRTYEVVASVSSMTVEASTFTPSLVVAAPLSLGTVRFPEEVVSLSVTRDSTIAGYLVIAAIDYSQPINPTFGGYNYLYSSSSQITIPWKHFLTLGTAKIYVYAFDKNYAEYIRNRKLGNPTQSLYELKDVIENGVGIFASASVDSVTVSIQ